MSASEVVISTIFRLLNFTVICAVTVYLFKSKMLPGIKEKIIAKYAALKELVSQNKNLLDQQRDLNREIKDQELFGKQLYDQISVWSISFEQQIKKQKEEQDALALQAVKRAQLQADNKVEVEGNIEILSNALAGAEKQLRSQFDSEKEGKEFTAAVIQQIRKESR